MRQKSTHWFLHFRQCPQQAERANRLVIEGKIRPVLDKVFTLAETAEAHQEMAENKHKGKMCIRVQAPAPA